LDPSHFQAPIAQTPRSFSSKHHSKQPPSGSGYFGEPKAPAPALPAHEKTHLDGSLSGTWKATAGALFRIDDDGTTLTVSLVRGDPLSEFNGHLTRHGEAADAKSFTGTMHVVFKPDAPRRHPIEVKATIDELGRLNLRCTDWPVWNSRGKNLGTRTLTETWTRQQ
jgi:hypothetical protein